MIKMFRFLAACLAGTAIYVLVSFTCGRDGIWADGQLMEQKRILSTRADEIQKINDGLYLEFTALEKDPDVIAGFARKMGYVRDGEKIVKINGLVSTDEYHFETGTPVKYIEPYYLPEWFCKLSGVLMFFVAYLYMSLKDFRNRDEEYSEKKSSVSVKGIPVYDLPQV
ncbi:MAG: septum formation initiator family protein [Treponema sp.]|nr:septum formation initiator family protein [Candidatus Treponema equifaecale]